MKMMKMKNDVLEFISSIFYPNRCIFCGELMPPLENLCDGCSENLPWIKGEICPNCGSAKEDCTCGKRHGNYYDGVASVFYYRDNVRECIHRFKFGGDKYAYRELSFLMSDCFRERYSDISFDYIVYVPMDRKRQKKRGYNQSELMARELSELLTIPFGKNLIEKIFPTDVQHECTELERRGNLLGAFDINPDYDVNGKTFLLVDDVKTSGATLNECGKMLYLRGADKVFCLTAAVVNSKIDEEKT